MFSKFKKKKKMRLLTINRNRDKFLTHVHSMNIKDLNKPELLHYLKMKKRNRDFHRTAFFAFMVKICFSIVPETQGEAGTRQSTWLWCVGKCYLPWVDLWLLKLAFVDWLIGGWLINFYFTFCLKEPDSFRRLWSLPLCK